MNIENLIISKNIKQLEYKDRLSLFEIPNYLGKDFIIILRKRSLIKNFFLNIMISREHLMTKMKNLMSF